MSKFSCFMAENALPIENVHYVASERFRDENGKPVKWEIKAVTSSVDEEIRKSCIRKVPVVGKKGRYTNETDFDAYVGKLASVCTVFPDLRDSELQNSYHALTPDELLKAMLMPGEYVDYLKKVQEVCGFDQSLEDDIEEAKN